MITTLQLLRLLAITNDTCTHTFRVLLKVTFPVKDEYLHQKQPVCDVRKKAKEINILKQFVKGLSKQQNTCTDKQGTKQMIMS